MYPVFLAEKLRWVIIIELLLGQLEEPIEPIEVNGQDEWVIKKILDT
jgi:hypothetical protein